MKLDKEYRGYLTGKAENYDQPVINALAEMESELTLLKPSADVCQECGVDHARDEPHDNDSLYYQIWFYGRYDRYPTWKDAIAHCSDKLKVLWKKELISRGAWTEPRKGKNDKGK